MKKFCSRMYNHLSISHNDGRITPCCWFNIDKNNWISKNNIEEKNSLDNIFNSDDWLKIQKTNEFKTGCEQCEQIEKTGFPSMRQNYDLMYNNNNFILEDLMLSLDFNCNMMCRICQPGLSSRWRKNKSLLDDLKILDGSHYNYDIDSSSHSRNVRKNIIFSDLSNLKRLHIVGGEPFFSKNLKWLLKYLDAEMIINNIELRIATNGSIFPDQETKKLLNKFKKLEILISIDGVEQLFEAIRFGKKWTVIDKNINKFVEEFEFINFHTTISILNINKLQSIIDYKNNVSQNIIINMSPLFEPTYLRYDQLEIKHRKKWKLKNDYSSFLELRKRKTFSEKQLKKMMADNVDFNQILLKEESVKMEREKFLTFTNLLDNEHGIFFKKVNPEIYDLVESYNEN